MYDVDSPKFDVTYGTASMLDPTIALRLDDKQVAAAKSFINILAGDYESTFNNQDPSANSELSHSPVAVRERIEKRWQNAPVLEFGTILAETNAY